MVNELLGIETVWKLSLADEASRLLLGTPLIHNHHTKPGQPQLCRNEGHQTPHTHHANRPPQIIRQHCETDSPTKFAIARASSVSGRVRKSVTRVSSKIDHVIPFLACARL